MKKLQVKIDNKWKYVFCQNTGTIITTEVKRKALDAKYHLDYFKSRYWDKEFQSA